MKPRAWWLLLAGLLAGLLAAWPCSARAQVLDAGVNVSQVIEFPTALDQTYPNLLQGTLEAVSISEPDLRPYNLRYGRQLGNLQLLFNGNWETEPQRQFLRADARAKLRVLNLDAYHTYAAIGAMARATDSKSKDETELDNKPYSLLIAFTSQLDLPLLWKPLLANVYADNQYVTVGVKVPVYQYIELVGEVVDREAVASDTAVHNRAGIEFQGEQNFFLQLYFSDQANNVLIQLGTGF